MFTIECQQVSKRFRAGPWWKRSGAVHMAVNNVSFQVKSGEILGLLGTNGCGKSTLIRMLSTLLLPDSGEIRLLGLDPVREPMAVREAINRVPVEASFFKKLSPWENLAYSARLYGVHLGSEKPRIEALLQRFGLEGPKLHASMEDMSRGMQQKVAIVRAFLTMPPILLLDEPTTGLDPVSKREVKDFVQEVRQTHNTTILLTTHDMQEAEQLCDRIAIMRKGCLVATDTLVGLRQQAAQVGEQAADLSLEDVFFRLTGTSLQAYEEELTHV